MHDKISDDTSLDGEGRQEEEAPQGPNVSPWNDRTFPCDASTDESYKQQHRSCETSTRVGENK